MTKLKKKKETHNSRPPGKVLTTKPQEKEA
jgi:hypothetical protein